MIGPVFMGRRPLNKRERDHVAALRRNADYIRTKLAEDALTPASLPRRTARAKNLAALEWAIENLAETPENERTRASLRALTAAPHGGNARRALGTDE